MTIRYSKGENQRTWTKWKNGRILKIQKGITHGHIIHLFPPFSNK